MRSSTSRPEERAEHALARDAHEQRAPQLGQGGEPGEEGQVVLQGLAEADAGVEQHPLLGHAGIDRRREPRGQVVAHLPHHVAVARVALHRAGVAAHVHQADGRPALGHRRQQGRIGAAGRDVVDQREARVQGGGRHRRQRGVDRQGERRRRHPQRAQDARQARELDVGVHRVRARARALGAHVADRGAVGGHPLQPRERHLRVDRPRAAPERVGGHVEDPHHAGRREPGERVGHGEEATPPGSVVLRVRGLDRPRKALRSHAGVRAPTSRTISRSGAAKADRAAAMSASASSP